MENAEKPETPKRRKSFSKSMKSMFKKGSSSKTASKDEAALAFSTESEQSKSSAMLAPGDCYDVTFNDQSLGLAIGHADDEIHFVVQKIAPGQKDGRLEVNDILYAINGEHLHEDDDVNHHSALPTKLKDLPRPLTVTFKKPSNEPVAAKDKKVRKLMMSPSQVTDEESMMGDPVKAVDAAASEERVPEPEESFPEPEDGETYETVTKSEESKFFKDAKPATSGVHDFLHQPHVAVFVAILALVAMAYLVLRAESEAFKEAEKAVIQEIKQGANPAGFLKTKLARK